MFATKFFSTTLLATAAFGALGAGNANARDIHLPAAPSVPAYATTYQVGPDRFPAPPQVVAAPIYAPAPVYYQPTPTYATPPVYTPAPRYEQVYVPAPVQYQPTPPVVVYQPAPVCPPAPVFLPEHQHHEHVAFRFGVRW